MVSIVEPLGREVYPDRIRDLSKEEHTIFINYPLRVRWFFEIPNIPTTHQNNLKVKIYRLTPREECYGGGRLHIILLKVITGYKRRKLNSFFTLVFYLLQLLPFDNQIIKVKVIIFIM